MKDLINNFREYRAPFAEKLSAYAHAVEEQHAVEGNEEDLLLQSATKVLEHAGIETRSELNSILLQLQGDTTINDEEADYWNYVAQQIHMPE